MNHQLNNRSIEVILCYIYIKITSHRLKHVTIAEWHNIRFVSIWKAGFDSRIEYQKIIHTFSKTVLNNQWHNLIYCLHYLLNVLYHCSVNKKHTCMCMKVTNNIVNDSRQFKIYSNISFAMYLLFDNYYCRNKQYRINKATGVQIGPTVFWFVFIMDLYLLC